MIIALFAFTAEGKRLRDRLAELLKGRGHQMLPESPPEFSLNERTAAAFRSAGALIFIGAAGIAVRSIAPFLRSKAEDPAVTVVDERGQWAISLLSGHLGGANELTRETAELLGAQPVITTATDINAVFAVDLWAKANDLVIGSMEKARAVSMRLLHGEDVPLVSDYPVAGKVPKGLVMGEPKTEAAGSLAGIRVSIYQNQSGGGDDFLPLIPRRVYLGIGCRKGVSQEDIHQMVTEALSSRGIDIRGVAAVGTIDLKKNESALVAFCRRQGWPLLTFTADELRAAGDGFSSSAFVVSAVGVDNVCERAAFLASQCGSPPDDSLLIRKFSGRGVAIAAAAGKISLAFDPRESRG